MAGAGGAGGSAAGRATRRPSLVTRQQVLDAAVQALVEHGYAGASTLRIQQLAGVSRGRLLHQYPSRDDLLVAAVAHLATARIAALGARTTWPADPGERIDAAVAVLWSTYREDYFWAATELWLAARHTPALAQALRPAERAVGEQVRAATDRMLGADLVALPSYAATRELLNTSMRGVALTYAFDHRPAATDPHVGLWSTHAHAALLG